MCLGEPGFRLSGETCYNKLIRRYSLQTAKPVLIKTTKVGMHQCAKRNSVHLSLNPLQLSLSLTASAIFKLRQNSFIQLPPVRKTFQSVVRVNLNLLCNAPHRPCLTLQIAHVLHYMFLFAFFKEKLRLFLRKLLEGNNVHCL